MRHALIILFLSAASPCYANASYELSQNEVESLQTTIADALIDPESATFRDISATETDAGLVSACGYVNAKNSFGGYVGFTAFFGSFRSDGFELRTLAYDGDEAQRTSDYCRMFGIWP